MVVDGPMTTGIATFLLAFKGWFPWLPVRVNGIAGHGAVNLIPYARLSTYSSRVSIGHEEVALYFPILAMFCRPWLSESGRLDGLPPSSELAHAHLGLSLPVKKGATWWHSASERNPPEDFEGR